MTDIGLKLLDDRLAFRRQVRQNNWVETHSTKEKLKLVSSFLIMAVDHKNCFLDNRGMDSSGGQRSRGLQLLFNDSRQPCHFAPANDPSRLIGAEDFSIFAPNLRAGLNRFLRELNTALFQQSSEFFQRHGRTLFTS